MNRLPRLLDSLSFLGLILIWVMTYYFYPELPDKIPIHFDGSGNPDNWGNKTSVIFTPILALFIFGGILGLSRFPAVFNYPFKITPENEESQRQNLSLMIQVLNLSVMILLAYLTYQSLQVALGQAEKLNPVGIYISLLILIGPIIFFLLRAWKLK